MRFKKLMKDKYDNKMSGVLSGISKYFGLNTSLLRIGYVIISLMFGIFPLLILYFILSIVVMDNFNKDYVEFKSEADEIKINKDFEIKMEEKKKKVSSNIFK